jgi:ABC-type lipopolysaccharide export system ATPase subunit
MIHTLEVDSVILDFGNNRVLQNVYLKSETGKITGLLGRNGTGKSCLMNIIYGELIPNDKSIRLNGVSIDSDYRNPADIRYLPQFSFIPKSFKIKKIFDDFKLDFSDFSILFPTFTQFYNVPISKLSGGERRIVEIYIILVSKSKFCMLDEPFSQVMPIHIDAIKSLIVREKKNKGIIVTDHLYKHIIDICEDLYVISNGQTYLTKELTDLEKRGYIRSLSLVDDNLQPIHR